MTQFENSRGGLSLDGRLLEIKTTWLFEVLAYSILFFLPIKDQLPTPAANSSYYETAQFEIFILWII